MLQINDWEFDIDEDATKEHSSFAAQEHCTCGYCENYYRTVRRCYPTLIPFLKRFGIDIEGPVEMYPFEPTVYLAGYRVHGRILKPGLSPVMVDGVPVSAEPREDGIFMIEVGEIVLPWVMPVHPDDVISPANEPEFLEKMYLKLLRRMDGMNLIS